jgi:hypothetical protein
MLVFSNQGSARNGKKIHKNFKYFKKFQTSLKILRGFLSENWQYWSNLRALPTVSFVSWPVSVFIARGSTMEERMENTAIFTSDRQWPCSEPVEI